MICSSSLLPSVPSDLFQQCAVWTSGTLSSLLMFLISTFSFTTPVPNNRYKEVWQSCSVHSQVPQHCPQTHTQYFVETFKTLKCSWAINFLYPLIIKANEMHNFSNLFAEVLYIFWTVDLSEICRVLSNKFEKLWISLAFIIRIYHDAQSSECQILISLLQYDRDKRCTKKQTSKSMRTSVTTLNIPEEELNEPQLSV
jgi:hypothetical protein